MANPILASEVLSLDSFIEAYQKIDSGFEKTIDSMRENATFLEKAIDGLTKKMKNLAGAIENQQSASDEQTKKAIELETQLKNLKNEQETYNQKIKETEKAKAKLNEQLGYEIGSLKDLETQQKKLRLEYEKTNDVQKKSEIGKKLAEVTEKLKAQKDALNEIVKVGTQNAKSLAAQSNEYAKTAARMSEIRKELQHLKTLEVTQNQLTDEQKNKLKLLSQEYLKLNNVLKDVDGSMGHHNRNVGNYQNSIQSALSTFVQFSAGGQNASGAIVGLVNSLGNSLPMISGITAGVAIAAEGLQAFSENAKKANEELTYFQKNLRITGLALIDYSGQLQALMQVYNVDARQLVDALNALRGQGISTQKGIDLISEALARGVSNAGQFLDYMREYPSALTTARVTMREAVAIMANSNKFGAYDNKLIDTIKNANIEFRDTAKVLKTLTPIFGKEFAESFAKQASEGQSVLVLMNSIKNQYDKTGASASELQTIATDLFTASGEDMGGFLKTLEVVNKSIDLFNKEMTAAEKKQVDYTKAVAETNKQFDILAKSFAPLGRGLSIFWEGVKTYTYAAINGIIDIFAKFGDAIASVGTYISDLFSELYNTHGNFQKASATALSNYRKRLLDDAEKEAKIRKQKEEFDNAEKLLKDKENADKSVDLTRQEMEAKEDLRKQAFEKEKARQEALFQNAQTKIDLQLNLQKLLLDNELRISESKLENDKLSAMERFKIEETLFYQKIDLIELERQLKENAIAGEVENLELYGLKMETIKQEALIALSQIQAPSIMMDLKKPENLNIAENLGQDLYEPLNQVQKTLDLIALGQYDFGQNLKKSIDYFDILNDKASVFSDLLSTTNDKTETLLRTFLQLAALSLQTFSPADSTGSKLGGLLQNIAGFEKGGPVEGGEQIIRINEQGQEYVINHQATVRNFELLNFINENPKVDAIEHIKNNTSNQSVVNQYFNQIDAEQIGSKIANEVGKQMMSVATDLGAIVIKKTNQKVVIKHTDRL